MDYDEAGFIADRPLEPKDWRTVCPNEPRGLVMAQGTVPPGVLMLYNYIGKNICMRLKDEFESLSGEISVVANGAYEEQRAAEISKERTSEYINPDNVSFDMQGFIKRAWLNFIAPHYHLILESYEKPGILRYKPGGEYIPHADAEYWDRESRQWRRSLDRDLSLLIYITDDYQGGELVFSNFGYRLKPYSGLLIAFPSDHRYIHAARPVTEGVRYAIVSWAKAKGTQRIETKRRPEIMSF